jgi:endogenous inhibitor of DNA gyrase (YacG/DUF329 family)
MSSKKLTLKSKTSAAASAERAAATSRSTILLQCPTCGKQTVYSNSNPCRPFCSRNCKLNDLAAWASDEYRVPENTRIGSPSGNNQEQDQGNEHEYEMENRSDESDQD